MVHALEVWATVINKLLDSEYIVNLHCLELSIRYQITGEPAGATKSLSDIQSELLDASKSSQ
jgi:hypothetical protein